MYVCICKAVTAKDIQKAVDSGVATLDGVKAATGASTCCGTCEDYLRDHLHNAAPCQLNGATLLPA